jgi:hypothetical protein
LNIELLNLEQFLRMHIFEKPIRGNLATHSRFPRPR